jgi:hypothetical protein
VVGVFFFSAKDGAGGKVDAGAVFGSAEDAQHATFFARGAEVGRFPGLDFVAVEMPGLGEEDPGAVGAGALVSAAAAHFRVHLHGAGVGGHFAVAFAVERTRKPVGVLAQVEVAVVVVGPEDARAVGGDDVVEVRKGVGVVAVVEVGAEGCIGVGMRLAGQDVDEVQLAARGLVEVVGEFAAAKRTRLKASTAGVPVLAPAKSRLGWTNDSVLWLGRSLRKA